MQQLKRTTNNSICDIKPWLWNVFLFKV